MDVVIRDTKTIAEFKAKKAIMEARAADCYAAHRAAFENWTDGDPVKACIHGTGRLSWSMLLVAGGTTGRPAPERSSGTDSLWMCLHPRNGGVFLLSEHGLPAPSAVVVYGARMYPFIHFLKHLRKFPLHAFVPSQFPIPRCLFPCLFKGNLSRSLLRRLFCESRIAFSFVLFPLHLQNRLMICPTRFCQAADALELTPGQYHIIPHEGFASRRFRFGQSLILRDVDSSRITSRRSISSRSCFNLCSAATTCTSEAL